MIRGHQNCPDAKGLTDGVWGKDVSGEYVSGEFASGEFASGECPVFQHLGVLYSALDIQHVKLECRRLLRPVIEKCSARCWCVYRYGVLFGFPLEMTSGLGRIALMGLAGFPSLLALVALLGFLVVRLVIGVVA
jgi:hypothetical protein